jgi:tetratricopeptide (TPR) repeat protein
MLSPRLILRVSTPIVWALLFACASQPGLQQSGPEPTAPEPPAIDAAPMPDSSAIESLIDRAEAERLAGNRQAEYALLARVLERDSAHPGAHARLAQLSGPAPASPAAGFDALVRRASLHPYDPAALVAAAGALAQRGRVEQAVEYLERAVWLADLDPSSARNAIAQLSRLSDDWSRRRIVPVQVHADELTRARPGWRFRIRTLWSSVSKTLGSVLETRFVPVVIGSFDAAEVPNDLDQIHERFVASARAPAEGILAVVTERAIPIGPGVFKKGVAEFLGRSLAVRLEPRAIQSRVLAHEILHLYGAIHVLDDVDTLMNPAGTSLVLDGPSIRIVRALRDRAFGPGGIEDNVLPRIDLAETVAAYRAALGVNLGFRDAGIAEALEEHLRSPEQAALRAQRATRLDHHLADAARMVAALMLADARREQALRLLDLSSQLYGADTPRGRQTAAQAEMLRNSLEAPASSLPQ